MRSDGNAEKTIPSSGHCILVVDDNGMSRDFLRTVLGSAGHEVVEVPSALKADYLLKKRADKYSLIIVDLNMPNIGGAEFIGMVRSYFKTKHLPIIVSSASTEPADVRAVAALGVQGYTVKPVKPETFLKLVSEVLGARPAPVKEKMEKKIEPDKKEPANEEKPPEKAA